MQYDCWRAARIRRVPAALQAANSPQSHTAVQVTPIELCPVETGRPADAMFEIAQ